MYQNWAGGGGIPGNEKKQCSRRAETAQRNKTAWFMYYRANDTGVIELISSLKSSV